jgi:hypothetical protein
MTIAPKRSDNEQSDRFKEAARELEADHDGASDKLMGRMAKMKPEPRKKPPPRKDGKPEDHKPGQ